MEVFAPTLKLNHTNHVLLMQTAARYKMVYLPESAPHRPGIVRVGEGGVSITAEEWSFPKAALSAGI